VYVPIDPMLALAGDNADAFVDACATITDLGRVANVGFRRKSFLGREKRLLVS
jgi:hypothetical protein